VKYTKNFFAFFIAIILNVNKDSVVENNKMETMIREFVFAVIGVLALLGLVRLSPLFRVWVYALLGNYTAAAKIYEQRLTRRPYHLHLYVKLAALYLLADRRDERALRAYRISWEILQAIQNSIKINPDNNDNWTCSTPVAI
jgi:tetratricopeptide (TPR) repeat protein